jgi:putative component of membrane protein insertase Oxa1/YidC/SpoIIIJ protein YidD
MRRRRTRMLRCHRPFCSEGMDAVSREKLGTDKLGTNDEFESAEDHFVPVTHF